VSCQHAEGATAGNIEEAPLGNGLPVTSNLVNSLILANRVDGGQHRPVPVNTRIG